MQYGVSQYGVDQYGQAAAGPSAPYFQAQSPAPGDGSLQPNISIYFEIVQSAGVITESDVTLYLNGTKFRVSGQTLSGFAVTVSAVTNGFSYMVTPASPLEPGTHTVRGTVPAGAADAMDESYTFDTVAQVITDADVAAIADQGSGLDLLLDPTAGDIGTELGDLSLVAGADEVAQHLRVGLRLLRGEWYLDDLAGVPYYQSFFVASPNTRIIETVLRQEILSDEDVEALPEFELELDRATRQLGVAFLAESTYGDVDVEAVFP